MRDDSARPSSVANRLDDADLDVEVQVAHHLLQHGHLLSVLAPEPCELRADEVEELHAHGGDAAEVARSGCAFEAERDALRLDPGREAGRVQLGVSRREQEVDAGRLRDRGVVLEVARVRREILGVAELGGVDEEARDEHVRLGACRREECFVAGVQRAHRRHEPDDAAPWDVELRERLDDDHGWVASTSAV